MNFKAPARYILGNAIAIVLTSLLIAGLEIKLDAATIALAALILSLTHVFIEPLLNAISLPINVMTMGLFHIVINSVLLYITTMLVDGMQIVGGPVFTSYITEYLPEVAIYSLPWFIMLVVVAFTVRFINIILKFLVF